MPPPPSRSAAFRRFRRRLMVGALRLVRRQTQQSGNLAEAAWAGLFGGVAGPVGAFVVCALVSAAAALLMRGVTDAGSRVDWALDRVLPGWWDGLLLENAGPLAVGLGLLSAGVAIVALVVVFGQVAGEDELKWHRAVIAVTVMLAASVIACVFLLPVTPGRMLVGLALAGGTGAAGWFTLRVLHTRRAGRHREIEFARLARQQHLPAAPEAENPWPVRKAAAPACRGVAGFQEDGSRP